MEQKNPLKIPKILWFQLFLLAIGYAFYSANRLSFGVGLKAVAASLSLTAVQLGTIGTIFTLGQALIDIPAGYLADRFGRKRMLIFGMVGLGCMTACVTTSASFVGAAFWRVCFGIFEGCWNIVMYSVAGSIFPAARAMLNGLMMTFYSIGAYVGPTYYGWSLERTGDWSIGLTHMGFVTVIFGLLLIFGFKKKYTDTSRNTLTLRRPSNAFISSRQFARLASIKLSGSVSSSRFSTSSRTGASLRWARTSS